MSNHHNPRPKRNLAVVPHPLPYLSVSAMTKSRQSSTTIKHTFSGKLIYWVFVWSLFSDHFRAFTIEHKKHHCITREKPRHFCYCFFFFKKKLRPKFTHTNDLGIYLHLCLKYNIREYMYVFACVSMYMTVLTYLNACKIDWIIFVLTFC